MARNEIERPCDLYQAENITDQDLLREVMNTVGSTIHVNFNTSKTSRWTFAEFTEVYQIEADFKDRV